VGDERGFAGMTRPRTGSGDPVSVPRNRAGNDFGGSVADLEPETRAFMASGEWGTAGPAHFVSLFSILHREVYGVVPALKKLYLFVFAQKLREHFGADPRDLAGFMYWAWSRERDRVQWLRDNSVPLRAPMTVRKLFDEEHVTGYRIHVVAEEESR
jgi:hypothetical protein